MQRKKSLPVFICSLVVSCLFHVSFNIFCFCNWRFFSTYSDLLLLLALVSNYFISLNFSTHCFRLEETKSSTSYYSPACLNKNKKTPEGVYAGCVGLST